VKIVSLEAENYKRLRAVEITPDGNLVVIGGRNAQGKSSVLDAIWAALGGREGNKASKPIRDGESRAKVRLDLGDMIVTRVWTGESSTVKVESADGAVFKSPQALLDGLIGRLSFDPLAFTRLSPKEQRESLLGIVDIPVDLDAIDQKRAELFTERTDIGRDGKAIGDVIVDKDLPETETSASDILAKIRAANDHNANINKGMERIAAWENAIATNRARIERLKEELAAAEDALADSVTDRNEAQAEVAALMPRVDVTELEEQLSSVEDTNAAIRANNVARGKVAAKAKLRVQYDKLTEKIADLDKNKADALAAAEFPVPGLGFSESGVTYQDVPFDQASSAEQIRVSIAMAISGNPKLRVMRILDGSLLDDDNLKLIAEAATEHDMQVWVERVGTGDEIGVIIEDGQVAS
jgi:uncharacterized coiled-coil protein SlyX